ncbi:hypothetical protein D3C79_773660 [compost metagenome]
MFKAFIQAHGAEHVHGVGPRRVGDHGNADALALGMLEQAQQAGGRLQGGRQGAKARLLAVGKLLVLAHRPVREQIAAQVGIGPAADVGIELRFGEHPAFFEQQLLHGQQVEFVGIGQGTVEVEQQGIKHGRLPLRWPSMITGSAGLARCVGKEYKCTP